MQLTWPVMHKNGPAIFHARVDGQPFPQPVFCSLHIPTARAAPSPETHLYVGNTYGTESNWELCAADKRILRLHSWLDRLKDR